MIEKIDLPAYDVTRVVVCGDLMLDRYWYGDVARISPEAPVPVVRIQDMEARPGGAANVALNMVSLGSQVTLLGLVGPDHEADELESLMTKQGVQCAFHRLPNYSTITKLRVLGQDQQLLRLDFEKPIKHIENDKNNEFVEIYRQCLLKTHAVVLSDYAKGTLSNPQQLIQLASDQGVPVLVDPKSNDFTRYRGATLITPNLKEFEATVGPCSDDDELIKKANDLIDNCNFTAILITRGKQGMMLVHKNHPPVNLLAQVRQVYDVTGAGDTVIAVIAASLAGQLNMKHAATLANLAAGIVVKKLGTSVVTLPELRRELQKANDSHVGILTEKDLLLTIADARAHGETIVMTNGCFDVLHAGHIQYLEAAKALGYRLVVAVNDDASVAKLKGKHRPYNSLQARMEVLAALRAVDWVVSFSEDTPARLVGKVLPDVLVKGGDYCVDEIVGGDIVTKNGGKVLSLALKEGFSTTEIVNRIREVKT